MASSHRNPLLDGFLRRVIDTPHATAVHSQNHTTTFKEIFWHSEAYRLYLLKHDFHQGQRVAILARPTEDLFALIIAVLRLGGVLVLADPGMGRDVFCSRMSATSPEWMFFDRQLQRLAPHPILRWILSRRGVFLPQAQDIPSARSIPYLRKGDIKTVKKLDINEGILPPFPNHQDQVIVFTSGTTNEPKGVVHTIGSLQASLQYVQALCTFDDASIVFTSLPYFLFLSLASGAHVRVAPQKFSARLWTNNVVATQPTHIFAAPSEMMPVANLLYREHRHLPESLKVVLLGSAPVTRTTLQRLIQCTSPETTILGVYGLTEMLPVAVIDAQEKITSNIPGDVVGTLLPGISATLGEDGELLLSGPHCFDRYLGGTSVTQVSTGDIATINGTTISLLGRSKDMVIRGNFNIYPRLYEPTIEQIPGVAACAMVGVWDDERQDERIILYVEPEPTTPLTVDSVRNSLCQPSLSIDEAAMPDEIRIATLPRHGRQQKIDKARLRQLL
jgi:acyl-CoA synthetase (AMP-forming)/AMP-acid ligase II